MKIYFYSTRIYDEVECYEKYSKEYGIGFSYSDKYPDMENLEWARGYEALSSNPCDMSEKVIKKMSEVGIKYLACRSIGYDHVDLDACRKYGIRVSNVSYPPEAVADYTIMMILMCIRNAGYIMKRTELQDFSLKGKIGKDLTKLTVGVIGTGEIGSTVIKHLSGFGCRILAYDPYLKKDLNTEYTDLDTLLKESDVITLHANATEENHHLLDEKAFNKMKDGVTVINTSRGKLIDTKALISAIKSGKVYSAGLDVLENENGLYYYNRMGDVIDNDELSILRSYPNVLILPHTAFYTDVTVENMVKSVFESVHCFQNNLQNKKEIR
ncbi:MAG: D-isomer specific 2-hydroxyacid dehydrogenase family protein [Erysipelotrichaceae bacterium]|nr:D-isomer specific 2-hydroxyacid dehydrogenase family protein [Erysipelotrichaceae bacterium]